MKKQSDKPKRLSGQDNWPNLFSKLVLTEKNVIPKIQIERVKDDTQPDVVHGSGDGLDPGLDN